MGNTAKTSSERINVVVGAVTCTLAVGLLAALTLLKALPEEAGTRTLTVWFPDGGGLSAGDRVKLRGVTVGSVQSVELRGEKVQVLLKVRRAAPLGTNPHFRVMFQSVLGGRCVEVLPGEGETTQKEVFSGQSPLDAIGSIGELFRQFTTEEPGGGAIHTAGEIARAVSQRKGLAGELLSSESRLKDALSTLTRELRGPGADLSFLLRREHSFREDLRGIASALEGLQSDSSALGTFLGLLGDTKQKELQSIEESFSHVEEAQRTGKGSTRLFSSESPFAASCEKFFTLFEGSGTPPEGLVGDLLDFQSESSRALASLLQAGAEPKSGPQPPGVRFDSSRLSGLFSALSGFFGFSGGDVPDRSFLVNLYGIVRFFNAVSPPLPPLVDFELW